MSALPATFVGPRHATWQTVAASALSGSAALWLLAALLGQWAFFYYIATFYGGSVLSGDFTVWNRLQAFGRTPFVAGDTAGNLAFLAHALGAGYVALGGALQLIPPLRARWPRLHRWNGRVFLITVVVLSLSGFYLVWGRRSSPSTLDGLSTSFNGLLILGFAWLAYRTARARDFQSHRGWALRLYLVSNAQWFLRVGVFGYFVAHQLLGAKASFGDPFLRFWSFGCYLLPLAVAELYLRAKARGNAPARLALAAIFVALTMFMSLGMVAFAIFSHKLASGAPLALPG